MTHSPTLRRDTSPMRTAGNPVASIFTTATSLRLSVPTIRALNSRLSGSVTKTWSAPSTTWALVITKPSADKIKPEPTPLGCSCSGCGRLGRCWRGPLGAGMGTPKKRRNSSCISSSGEPACASRADTFSNVRILTTDGPTCSTKSVKSGKTRLACAEACACAMEGVTPNPIAIARQLTRNTREKNLFIVIFSIQNLSIKTTTPHRQMSPTGRFTRRGN